MPIIPLLKMIFDLKKIMGFMMRHWKEILMALMAFIIWYQNSSTTRFMFGMQTIPALQEDLDYANGKLRECGNANELLSNTITSQNKVIDDWKILSESLKSDIEKKSVEIENLKNKTKKDVDNILKEDTPKSCLSSIVYLRDSIEELTWDD